MHHILHDLNLLHEQIDAPQAEVEIAESQLRGGSQLKLLLLPILFRHRSVGLCDFFLQPPLAGVGECSDSAPAFFMVIGSILKSNDVGKLATPTISIGSSQAPADLALASAAFSISHRRDSVIVANNVVDDLFHPQTI